jgi:hypothetical protein
MTYSNANLNLHKSGLNAGPASWIYTSTDAHTDVDAASYFSDGKKRGMKLNDIVIVVDTSAHTTTLHHVQSVSGNACTISSATLA